MTTQLTRKAVDVRGLKALSDEAVLAEVKEVLGYGGVDEALTLKRVAEVLAKLDIEPFDPKIVAAYKKEQADALKSRKRKRTGWGYTVATGVWVDSKIQDYKQGVPAFALLRATQVKKALTAQGIASAFHVEELTKRQHRVVLLNIDPFMVLHVGSKKFYLDVWNEPKFEGRRTK